MSTYERRFVNLTLGCAEGVAEHIDTYLFPTTGASSSTMTPPVPRVQNRPATQIYAQCPSTNPKPKVEYPRRQVLRRQSRASGFAKESSGANPMCLMKRIV